uniref:Uncharacterized protein n=1 Tax=Anguilla anguilla TaxID=7936 RepID=A0A0E9Q5Q2_ANGAN
MPFLSFGKWPVAGSLGPVRRVEANERHY